MKKSIYLSNLVTVVIIFGFVAFQCAVLPKDTRQFIFSLMSRSNPDNILWMLFFIMYCFSLLFFMGNALFKGYELISKDYNESEMWRFVVTAIVTFIFIFRIITLIFF